MSSRASPRDDVLPLTQLAITAAAPMFRGYLVDVDCRWDVIAGAVDDRTEQERGLKVNDYPQETFTRSSFKARDSSPAHTISVGFLNPVTTLAIPTFQMTASTDRNIMIMRCLSMRNCEMSCYKEVPILVLQFSYHKLTKCAGVDHLLANHIAHLFIRDPIVVFSETLDQDDGIQNDHFENIQSTNWQTCRFKPPPIGTNMGWRVEFRSMEIQLTEYENAAFAIFIVLLSRAIIQFGTNFYMPMSKVDLNMHRAQQRNAVHDQKFYFRNSTGPSNPAALAEDQPTPSLHTNGSNSIHQHQGSVDSEYSEMSLAEIFGGKDRFPGLLNVVRNYLDYLNLDKDTRQELDRYLVVIEGRANGGLVLS